MKLFGRIIGIIGTVFVSIGIILVIVAVCGGGHFISRNSENKNTKTYVYDQLEKDTKIQNIDIDVNSDYIKIEEGDSFRVKGARVAKDKFSVSNDNGTLRIKDTTRNGSHIFGLDFDFYFWDWDLGNNEPKITVTVPSGFIAKETTVRIDSGKLKSNNYQTEKFTAKLNAGKIEMDEFTASEKSDIHVNAGSFEVKHYSGKNMNASVNAGNIEVAGKFAGNNTLSCKAGNVDINGDGDSDDYYYKYKVSAGNVTINDENYHGDGMSHEGAANGFDIDCSVGNINVQID